ncbi:MAG: polysaccharide deacetylase family protein [Candidatus Eremiobacteraeota bacterium]|nr:polysaccharide deacetylase family protein [Candidatus Eremiobacteraeota bacterium]MCW5872628.1 polysaccharide deacetylase family protein [Candidatus Eremiobacteraeota bacterium]
MRWVSVLLLLLTLTCAGEPAHWDGLIEHAPSTKEQADGLSARLNQAYAAEVQRLGGPPWWLDSVRSHCQENLKAAGEHSEAPPLSQAGRRFIADYALEQQRLARLQGRYPSEIRWTREETVGWEMPDRSFQLTFDDGPKAGISQAILASLRQYRYPATFFVLGKRLAEAGDKRPDYSGFVVASHSHDHANLVQLSPADLSAEFSHTEKQAQRSGLKLARLFRAPYGSRAQRELTLMKKLGLRSTLWNVDSQDWQADMQTRPGRIASRTLALMLLHRHGIVLMHDVQPQTPAELARLLPVIPRLGFRISP